MDDMQKLEGRYFPAGGSASRTSELHRKGEVLAVVPVDGGASIEVALAEISDRLASVPTKISFEDGSVFECSDSDQVDEFFGREKHFFSRMTRAEGSLKFVLVALVATVLLLVGLYRYGLPAAANLASRVTPPALIETIDASTLGTVDRALFNPSNLDEARKSELLSLFDELVSHSGQTNPPLRLLFRDGGRLGANAIALPGGTIVLTDQLVGLAESEDEIAGVLAHEIGHVEHQHSLRQIYRGLGVAFMISVIGGDSGQIVEDVIAQAALVDTFSYSRKFEGEADTHSLETMVKAGRDPLAFLDLLERILGTEDAKSDDTSWASTHPGNFKRREDVTRQLEQMKH